MNFETLKRFITEKMKMTEVYQPLVIRTLIENGGSASTRQLALAALPYDTSQVEYYEQVMKRWPKITLKKHDIISYQRDKFALNANVSLLSEYQKAELTSLCTQKIQEFLDAKLIQQQKAKIPTHISGLMRYEVLRRAKSRCVLCGITKEQRALDVDHLNKNLGFSPEDREENIRRIGEVAKLFADAGVIGMTAFISPYRIDRDNARALLDDGRFVEIFVDCPLEVCEARDTKGLYQKARAGEIKEFTGISAPYEAPSQPELIVNTNDQSLEECTERVITLLESKGLIPTS